jgi:hypothetical protein
MINHRGTETTEKENDFLKKNEDLRFTLCLCVSVVKKVVVKFVAKRNFL